MDSGNSGSMQSSSGGDEEYDSRPAFLNSHHFGSLSSNPQHQLSLLSSHHQQPTLFDPSPNLFQAFSQSPGHHPNLNSSLLNLDVVGSSRSGLRSDDPDCTDLGGSSLASVAASSSRSILGSSQAPVQSMQLRSVQENGARVSSPSDQNHVAPRNPKKRTRASRRAPTTVLTTDTSNFRAMVQEFTGIPAPPFSGSPYSRRLDLFGSAMRSGGHLEPVASLYPLRPSAQKVHQQSPFLFSSSSSSSSFMSNTMVDGNTNIGTTSTTTVTSSIPATTGTFNPSSISYQLPSDLGLPKQPQNLLNTHSQMLSFQSLLSPPPPLHPSLNAAGLSAKSQANLAFEDHLGISHRQVNANLGGVVPSHGNQDHLRSLDSCKLNYSTSSSDFHHEKGLENVPPRGGGTVDSWICPSD